MHTAIFDGSGFLRQLNSYNQFIDLIIILLSHNLKISGLELTESAWAKKELMFPLVFSLI